MKRITTIIISIMTILLLVGCQPLVQQEIECPTCNECPEQKECPTCEVCPEEKVCSTCEICIEKTCERCESSQIPEGKAMLDAGLIEWGENEFDSSETLFNYWITNYGDTESNNVRVRCLVLDINGNVVWSMTDDYGNIASKTIQLDQIETDRLNDIAEYSADCHIQSCSNCDILYKRIPELVEGYES